MHINLRDKNIRTNDSMFKKKMPGMLKKKREMIIISNDNFVITLWKCVDVVGRGLTPGSAGHICYVVNQQQPGNKQLEIV